MRLQKSFGRIVRFTTNIWYIFGHFTHFFCGISYFWVRFMGGTELSCPGLTSFLLGPLPFPYNMIICGNPAISYRCTKQAQFFLWKIQQDHAKISRSKQHNNSGAIFVKRSHSALCTYLPHYDQPADKLDCLIKCQKIVI